MLAARSSGSVSPWARSAPAQPGHARRSSGGSSQARRRFETRAPTQRDALGVLVVHGSAAWAKRSGDPGTARGAAAAVVDVPGRLRHQARPALVPGRAARLDVSALAALRGDRGRGPGSSTCLRHQVASGLPGVDPTRAARRFRLQGLRGSPVLRAECARPIGASPADAPGQLLTIRGGDRARTPLRAVCSTMPSSQGTSGAERPRSSTKAAASRSSSLALAGPGFASLPSGMDVSTTRCPATGGRPRFVAFSGDGRAGGLGDGPAGGAGGSGGSPPGPRPGPRGPRPGAGRPRGGWSTSPRRTAWWRRGGSGG